MAGVEQGQQEEGRGDRRMRTHWMFASSARSRPRLSTARSRSSMMRSASSRSRLTSSVCCSAKLMKLMKAENIKRVRFGSGNTMSFVLKLWIFAASAKRALQGICEAKDVVRGSGNGHVVANDIHVLPVRMQFLQHRTAHRQCARARRQ
jgi:hypothetical protein